MKNLKEGSLVWVKRRNGSWWPGRIMGLDELSPSARLKSSSAKPVRLLGREYSSVDWYNLESGRIKAFRCNEFADFIKNAEGLKASPLKEHVKYAHRTDAIIHALELENKEPRRKRKMTDRKAEAVENKPVCRLKRSRCVYLPVGSRKNSECTSFHAQPLPLLVRMAGDPYQSSASENNYSSRSPDNYTFGEYAPNGRADETSKQLSGCCSGYPGTRRHKRHEELSGITRDDRILDDVEAPKKKIMLKLKHLNPYRDLPDGQRFIASGNAIQNDSNPFTVDDAKCQKRTGCSGKQSRKPIRDLYFSSQFEDGGLEISRRQTRSMSSGEPLIDIKLTVETRYEGASVPLVSLMSKVNRKSIIGYPVEVEKLKNGSTEIILPINDNAGNQILDTKGTLKLQSFPRTPACHRPATSPLTPSVRTTARRTSVSYSPAPSPPIKKEFQSLNVPSKNIDSRLVKRENNSLPGEMLQNLPAVVTCIPVKLIFSRLAAAVQLQPEANIHS
ncbi:hypothetical protein ACET3Z_004023 [Daucus carota]